MTNLTPKNITMEAVQRLFPLVARIGKVCYEIESYCLYTETFNVKDPDTGDITIVNHSQVRSVMPSTMGWDM